MLGILPSEHLRPPFQTVSRRSSKKFAKKVVINSSFEGCAVPSVGSMVRMLLMKERCEFGFTHLTRLLRKAGPLMRRPIVLLSTMSIAVLLICGVELAGCGAMGGPEEASKPKPELTTVAGDGGSQLGDGGPAKSAGFCGPNDVCVRHGRKHVHLGRGDLLYRSRWLHR